MLPLVGVAVLVAACGVDVPNMDEWTLPEVFSRLRDGNDRWTMLWQGNNEHRIAVPKLVYYLLAVLTGWDTRAEMVGSVVLAAIGFLAICGLAARSASRERSGTVFGCALVASSFVYFSLMQHENWLWGFQIAFFIVQTAFLLAVYVLNGTRRSAAVKVAIAGGLGVVASCSMLHGPFIWPALLPSVAVVGGSRKSRACCLIVWVALGVATVAVYLWGLPGNPEASGRERNPIAAVVWTFGVLGSQFGRTFWSDPTVLSVIGGLILLAVTGAGFLAAGWRRLPVRERWPRGFLWRFFRGCSAWRSVTDARNGAITWCGSRVT